MSHGAAPHAPLGFMLGSCTKGPAGRVGWGWRGALGLQADSGMERTGRKGSRCFRAFIRSRHTCSAPSPLPHDGPPAWLVSQEPGSRAQPAAAPAGGSGAGPPEAGATPPLGFRLRSPASPPCAKTVLPTPSLRLCPLAEVAGRPAQLLALNAQFCPLQQGLEGWLRAGGHGQAGHPENTLRGGPGSGLLPRSTRSRCLEC